MSGVEVIERDLTEPPPGHRKQETELSEWGLCNA